MVASQLGVTTKKVVTVCVTFSVLHVDVDICSDSEHRVMGLCLPSRACLSADTESTQIRAAFVSYPSSSVLIQQHLGREKCQARRHSCFPSLSA